MRSKKKNPNNVQIRYSKTTRPGSIEESKDREYQEILDKKEKKVKGDSDEGAADEQPFDAKSNNMHQKR
jgi:hypothetical protein